MKKGLRSMLLNALIYLGYLISVLLITFYDLAAAYSESSYSIAFFTLGCFVFKLVSELLSGISPGNFVVIIARIFFASGLIVAHLIFNFGYLIENRSDDSLLIFSFTLPMVFMIVYWIRYFKLRAAANFFASQRKPVNQRNNS